MDQGNKKTLGLVLVAVIVLGLIWWLAGREEVSEPSPIATSTRAASLGAEIYEGVKNPVADKVPESNPIKDVYKNPFE